jgi:hypothetical protein
MGRAAGLSFARFAAVAQFHPFTEWDKEACAENNVDQTDKLISGTPVDNNPAF